MHDTSKRFRKKTRRGSLDNIAVKLYGTSYDNAHPTKRDKIDTNTMFHPWFEGETTNYAFSVTHYRAIEGGANVDKTGEYTPNSVDIALLTVNTGEFFKNIEFPMDVHLTRLKWVNKEKDKLTGGPPSYKNLQFWLCAHLCSLSNGPIYTIFQEPLWIRNMCL